MRSQQTSPVLRLHPELWAGCVVPFDKQFSEAFKQLVVCGAWDPMAKCRWFPISNLQNVKQLIREHKLVSDASLDNAAANVQAELDVRRAVRRAAPAAGDGENQLANDYAMLGLHVSCPRVLLEWAIIFWRKELGALGVPSTDLLLKEEAYQRILQASMGVVS
jgi:hypothetical protein